MRKKWRKTGILAMTGIGMLSGAALMAEAGTSKSLWNYEMTSDAEGNIVYGFEEVELTLPADWEGKYKIVTGYNTKTQNGYAAVYHTASREALTKEYGMEEGGCLFTLTCSSDYGFMDTLPAYQIIGNGEGCVYYAALPTDVQGYTEDQEIWNEWVEIHQDVNWVLGHIQMTRPGEGVVEEEGSDLSEDEYIIADSSETYLTAEDLEGMSANELQMAINEIYARHHRKFATKSIQKYFDAKSWYSGTVEAEKFDPVSLNQYENQNIAFIIRCMNGISGSAGEYMEASGSVGGFADAASGIQAAAGTKLAATTTVNIRSRASVDSAVMGIVPRGHDVTVTGSVDNGWVPVNYNGITGYIKQEYLGTAAANNTGAPGEGSQASGNTSSSGTEEPPAGTNQAGSADQNEANDKISIIRGSVISLDGGQLVIREADGSSSVWHLDSTALSVFGDRLVEGAAIDLEYDGSSLKVVNLTIY